MNWKLQEIAGYYEVVDNNSDDFRVRILKKLKLPLTSEYSIDRSCTEINWNEIPNYNKVFIDVEEDFITSLLKKSALIKHDKLILTFGFSEPTIKIKTSLFFDDWEGFIRGQLWEGLIFSEDYKLMVECSRDYYLHSNFKI